MKVSLHNDNKGAIKLAANPVFYSHSKHIDIKRHFIREVLTEKNIELSYTSTEEMIADLTKARLLHERNGDLEHSYFRLSNLREAVENIANYRS